MRASTRTLEVTFMFDQNDQAGLAAAILAFQTRCALGIGRFGTNSDVFVQLAVTSPNQQAQIITAPGGTAVNSLQARTNPSAYASENINYDNPDKRLAGLGAIVETAFDLLNDPSASITGTLQETPIFFGGIRGSAQNHSVQVAIANGQVVQKHIETVV
jgi:hypothetical protein